WRVVVPPDQGCCGALALHAGDRMRALAQARATLDAFVRATPPVGAPPPIVVNAAGCGAMMKEWGELFADDPDRARAARTIAAGVDVRVRHVVDLLADAYARR